MIDEMPWLIHEGRVVLRPKMHSLYWEAENRDFVPNALAGLAAAVDIACREHGRELVATRDVEGWAVGCGVARVRGETLEGALRGLTS